MAILVGGPQESIKYVATAPDGSRCAFNDPSDADYVGMARFAGLDSPDIREALDMRAGADGGVQGMNFRGPRPITAQIEILGTSTTNRNQKWQKLRRALNALRADGTLTFTPDGGAASQVKFRLNQPIRKTDEPGWLHKVQIGLMAADSYIYGQTLNSSTVNASPWTAVVENKGDGPSAPTFTVPVATVGSVLLTNQTTGRTLSLPYVDPAMFFGTWNTSYGGAGAGSGNGQFNGPTDVTFATGGTNILIADYWNHRIQTLNGTTGAYVSQFGTFGTGNGQFKNPSGVAIDSTGNIFVADTLNHRIQKFNSAGTYVSQFGSLGSGNGQFNRPMGIDIDSSNNIFVADTDNRRIQMFNSAFTWQRNIGSAGSGDGQLGFPKAVLWHSGTDLFVADSGNYRVQKFNTSTGAYISKFGSQGAGDGQFGAETQGIARDNTGNLYVSDTYNHRVQKFNSSGSYLSQFGSQGTGPSQFYYPEGLVVTPAANTPLYVADFANNRIAKIDMGSLTLAFDFSVAAITAAGQNWYRLLDVPNSTWWVLQPGNNTIQVLGGSSWTINWRDAWL